MADTVLSAKSMCQCYYGITASWNQSTHQQGSVAQQTCLRRRWAPVELAQRNMMFTHPFWLACKVGMLVYEVFQTHQHPALPPVSIYDVIQIRDTLWHDSLSAECNSFSSNWLPALTNHVSAVCSSRHYVLNVLLCKMWSCWNRLTCHNSAVFNDKKDSYYSRNVVW